MSKINYQALREAAEKATWGDWDSYKPHRGARGYEVRLSSQAIAQHVLKNNAEFIAAFNPKVALALLDERERNQQYVKRRDQENEEIALTVGKLRVELEAVKSKLNEQREYYKGVIAYGGKRIAELVAELVSQTYKLPTLSSNEVNDAAWKLHDMLTEHGPLNGRQFNNLKGCFYEALKVAMRNSPVTPSVWMSCSERMPDDAQWCVVEAADGYYVQCWSEGQGWLGDDISLRNCDVIRWMSIPEPPQQEADNG
ncbi:ead/Ea22-like family protein [Escherichia coli]|uniref:ead/Ea22-like family protein n=1 Tax=Escherichia coli TaxID=562 RepID=UPI002578A311|nr:ead/Ea22-like family protein [Escherichia coli]ELC6107141.1 ead/Ea22-like family protein [Escherichia coli]MDM1106748.1 ead/Ea22-like family protein [Escherichia coli]MEB6361809.1 ead/Ea22-like family protein [Escherichia coli]